MVSKERQDNKNISYQNKAQTLFKRFNSTFRCLKNKKTVYYRGFMGKVIPSFKMIFLLLSLFQKPYFCPLQKEKHKSLVNF